MTAERESFPLDVLFVGGGPACLAGAIHLASLAKRRAEDIAAGRAGGPVPALEIGVIEKGREFGHHGLSGAVLNPAALAELLPDHLDRGCPVARRIEKDAFYFLTASGHVKVPHFLVPPENDNKGFYTISLQRLTQWLAQIAEQMGVNLFPGTTGVEILWDGDRVAGVRTGDKGLVKDGGRKPNFEPGIDLQARVTIFGEGPYGTLTEDLIHRRRLREGRNPQVYSLGCKEVIQVPRTAGEGLVLHTLGFPLRSDQFGGGFFYELDDNTYSVGFVASMAWRDPRFDCHAALQTLKKHPLIQSYIKGGEVLAYGAKAIPEGGYWSVPRPYAAGALLVGDSAGLVNVKQLKGIHYAMKSGMLAAETALEALLKDDVSEQAMEPYARRLEESYVMRDLWKERNFRLSFDKGLYRGLMATGIHRFTGGGSRTRRAVEPDHLAFRHIAAAHRPPVEPQGFDPSTIVDKLTDVFKSGTIHREDQPSHIKIVNPQACLDVCIPRHGDAPCTHFCPAKVYELVEDAAGKRVQVNFTNCVHCKTCVILDPVDVVMETDHIQNIDWRAPAEGGPKYLKL
ncbi:MAG TPA: electron-transfer flavoprotein:ubiquinone oxidoreductase [Candidatus Polarisedimenticolia bacterium]|nr:electron-transfer flavoprotein:ubiquinone oxidoreductase [Candidatus Polarisedimenticolia bacterium]